MPPKKTKKATTSQSKKVKTPTTSDDILSIIKELETFQRMALSIEKQLIVFEKSLEEINRSAATQQELLSLQETFESLKNTTEEQTIHITHLETLGEEIRQLKLSILELEKLHDQLNTIDRTTKFAVEKNGILIQQLNQEKKEFSDEKAKIHSSLEMLQNTVQHSLTKKSTEIENQLHKKLDGYFTTFKADMSKHIKKGYTTHKETLAQDIQEALNSLQKKHIETQKTINEHISNLSKQQQTIQESLSTQQHEQLQNFITQAKQVYQEFMTQKHQDFTAFLKQTTEEIQSNKQVLDSSLDRLTQEQEQLRQHCNTLLTDITQNKEETLENLHTTIDNYLHHFKEKTISLHQEAQEEYSKLTEKQMEHLKEEFALLYKDGIYVPIQKLIEKVSTLDKAIGELQRKTLEPPELINALNTYEDKLLPIIEELIDRGYHKEYIIKYLKSRGHPRFLITQILHGLTLEATT